MKSSPKTLGFTLVEIMVAMAVTIMVIGLLATIADATSRAWRKGEGQAETFASARGALGLIGRELQGAVIDPDMGYIVQSIQGSPNNFVLKFLARRTPIGTDTAAVEKVAYQLAWASDGLVPEVRGSYDAKHTLPVLIRTSNSTTTKTNGVSDVFKITSGKNAWDWARNWGNLAATTTIQTGQQNSSTGDVTEVVAENVLGWRINPIYWDPVAPDASSKKGKLVIDNPASTPRYYDDPKVAVTAARPPKYITSDLKYVKKADPTKLSTIRTDSAPRAIEIRLLSLPSHVVPRLKDMQGWSSTRETAGLFDYLKLADSPFNNLIRQNAQTFDATFYLSSKTP
jgi:hypothetical protein